ncbi:MAG: hypothetical protein SGI90_11460 [Candidatus Eisenbacteria bacterium]|nr:hypothetical protein [Candidatus Eisenbacteria bacterium]
MKAFEFGTVGLSQNDGMRMVGHEPSRDRVYASASIEVTGTGVYSWRGAALAADVQMWLDDASSNWGGFSWGMSPSSRQPVGSTRGRMPLQRTGRCSSFTTLRRMFR